MAQAAQAAGKYAANKFLKTHMKEFEGKKVAGGQDPYFAMVEDPKRPGKLKKVRKQIPAYIPEHDAMILASVRKNAYRLDMCLFNFLGCRFGWESVIGLIPAAGDVMGSILALLVVGKAMQVEGGLSKFLLFVMVANIALDLFIGVVPVLGDLADALYKCNTRNLRLLEIHLDKKYRPKSAEPDERDFAGTDRVKRESNRKSGIYHPRDPPPATAWDDSDEEDVRQGFGGKPVAEVPESTDAKAHEKKQGGWFSRSKTGN